MKRIKSILLLITLLVLLVGIASASDVSDVTIGADSPESACMDTPAVEEVTVQEKSTPTMDVQVNVVNKKDKITREEKTLKTASHEYNVNNYEELNNSLTWDGTNNNITINIKDNIKLEGNLSIDSNIVNVTINGEAKKINGDDQYHFLDIGTGQKVTINNLTITNCTINQNTVGDYNGGAITNKGNLTIKHSTLTENQAKGWYGSGGAITNYGYLTVNDTQFTYNTAASAGAIYNEHANLTIKNSTFTNNTAIYTGGAIINYNYSNLNVTNTQFINNNASTGGAINNNKNSNLTVTGTQFTDNSAEYYGGAIYNYNDGTLTVNNTQFTGNHAGSSGGAIYNYDSTIKKINNTIFYNNTPANFIINQTTGNIQLLNDDNYITLSKVTLIVDGEEVLTNAEPEQLNTYTIPEGHLVKIIINGTNTINNEYIISDTINVTGYQKLIDAIEAAKKIQYVNVIINLQPEGNYDATASIDWSNSATRNITINGNGVTLKGLDTCQFITIAAGHNLKLENITITNYTATRGGAIRNYGTLTVTQTQFTSNHASWGGAIYNYGHSTLTVTGTQFTGNNATGGGAIYNGWYSNLTVTETQFTGNNATSGGAIYNYLYSNLTVTETQFTDNNATIGGAICNNNTSNLTINNSILEYNNATSGGAIYNNNSYSFIQENYFIANTAPMTGNAIINEGTATIENNEGDTTTQYNGTIYTKSDLTVTIKNNKFYDKYNTNINITTNNTNPTVGDTIKLTFTLKDMFDELIAQENITITIDQTNNITTNTEGIATMEYTVKSNDTLVTATYPGNNKYSTNTTTLNITAQKLDTQVLLDDVDTKVGKAFNITGKLLEDGNPVPGATVKITVNGSTKPAITNDLGQFNTNFTLYESGEYNITALFPETSAYKSSTNNTAKITATKTDTKLTLNVSNTTIVNSTEITITVNLTDIDDNPLDGEDITITIGDETFIVQTSGGVATRNYTTKQLGTQTITAKYNGNNMYNANTSTTDITVYKIDTKLTLMVSSNTPVNSTPINITMTLTGDTNTLANQDITLNINGENHTIKTNANGVAIKEYTPTTLGKQTITAQYNGDSQYYNSTTKSVEINVIKIDTKLTLQASDKSPINSTPINITATLTDANGNKLSGETITINVNGKTYNVKTDNNGIATQNYTPTRVETQTITATYNGDSKYVNSTATANITIKKINTKLVVKVSNTTSINNTQVNITATLTDTNGDKLAGANITITVAGKTYTVKTDANGVATKAYTPTTLGKQTITASYKGDSKYINSTATTDLTVKKINTKITLQASNTTPINNTPINITATLTDASGNKLAGQNIILNINGKKYTVKTDSNGSVTKAYTPTVVESQTITATYNGNSMYNNSTKSMKIAVKNKINTKTTVTPVSGVIGEKLTIKATVTDTNGNNVNEGNLIFKVNGVTIKDNGKLTGSDKPLKVKVVNGVATATIIPDINMTNAKNITASYIGTTIYNASISSPSNINISKRNATIEVSINKKIIKQGRVLTITAKIYDTTNGKKTNNITKYQDEYVYFKINGITLKDADGNMLKVKIVNGTATVNYTIPLGISCVTDTQTMTVKNHTIQVGLYNKNYQNIMTKTPTFQVERSNITINIANATVNNKTHKLSLQATIRDYLGNVVSGPNKCVIKVNGLSLKNGNQPLYFYSNNGILELKDITIPAYNNYKTIEIVTQDRLAYKSQRNMTTTINVLN
ncbi:S-layer family protein [Methanosphaera sp. BMS]|uniref:beta strand repeat-containing protein n=1 Tax=Methanosphaera sp. BMS TaxID=1789762 RepID=UPI000DC1E98C|nr:Ig-like domain repeat protein [Methanosphaera sp. BMS]AWX32123.1 hypothetical protein AW729_02975 [Methanosphaera sp. BMS]